MWAEGWKRILRGPCVHAINARLSEHQGNPQGTHTSLPEWGGAGGAGTSAQGGFRVAVRGLGMPTYSPVCVLCYVVCTMFLTQLGFLRSEMMNWDQVHMCRYKMILSTKTYLTILRVKKQLPRVLSLFGTNEWKQTTQQIKWTERERWIP